MSRRCCDSEKKVKVPQDAENQQDLEMRGVRGERLQERQYMLSISLTDMLTQRRQPSKNVHILNHLVTWQLTKRPTNNDDVDNESIWKKKAHKVNYYSYYKNIVKIISRWSSLTCHKTYTYHAKHSQREGKGRNRNLLLFFLLFVARSFYDLIISGFSSSSSSSQPWYWFSYKHINILDSCIMSNNFVIISINRLSTKWPDNFRGSWSDTFRRSVCKMSM